MLELMEVVETVTRTREVRVIDHLMADGIVAGARKGGYKITAKWARGIYVVLVFRPGAALPMLTYSVRTD